MKNTAFRIATAFSALLLVSIPAAAQQTAPPEGTEVSTPADASKTAKKGDDKTAEEKKAEEETTDIKILKERPISMQQVAAGEAALQTWTALGRRRMRKSS